MINLKIKDMNQMGLLVNNLEQVVTLKQQNKEPPWWIWMRNGPVMRKALHDQFITKYMINPKIKGWIQCIATH